MAPGRSLVAAVVAASMTLAGGLEARAQVPDEPTTTTEPPPPAVTTTPAPDDVAPSNTTTTTAPPPPTTTALSPTQPPATTTTTAPAPPAAAGAVPPPGGGDAAPPPPGALPVIPPELQARIDSVRRTGSNSTVRLLEKLEPLRAMGMTEQEAVQAGFGRFPVGGRATYTDDWWFPRFVPSVHLHEGTDIFAAYGTPVRAPANGVLRQTFGAVGGLSAYVHERDDTYYYLAHLSRYEAGQVSGQEVKVGDVIGYVGDSGNARGSSPHVHFEIHPRGGGPVNPKPRLDAWLKEALAAVPRVVAQAAPRLGPRAAAAPVAAEEQDLTVVGHTDLGGVGGAGDVAVVGDTALVARGFVPPGTPAAAADEPPCEGAASLVDLSDPAKPAVAGAIELPGGQRVEDLDAVAVRSPAFTGDLAALVAAPCNGDGATELAYYDVTDAERPRLLARLPHPRELADTASARGACAQRLRGTCPRTGRTVSLQQDASGRVVSLSASAVGRGASEVYAVDASDPRSPLGLGWFPVPGGRRASSDPCAPVTLEQPPPPQQGLPGMGDGAGFRWATEARVPPGSGPDGLGAHAAVVEAGGRRLALAADDSWWSSTWAVRVDPPAPLAGDKLGCSGPLPGADATATGGAATGGANAGPTAGTADATAAGGAATGGANAGPTAGNLVYVGRGCPERRGADGAVVPADPYLADPAGRVAVADAALAPVQPAVAGPGCTPADRLARARQAGALGLVVAGSFLAGDDAPATGAGPDEGPASGPAETRPPVPGVQLRKPDGDALRDALCPPAPPAASCGAAAEVHASLVELPGQWGGLRVLDVTNPEAPRQVEVYRPAGAITAAPGDAGSYAVHAAVGDGARVYAAWGAEGLRVIDLTSGSPVESASFVPPERTDAAGAPVPAHVTGVAHTAGHIVVTDLSSGLWVLDKRPPAGSRGYWLADADGGVHAFGDAPFLGSASDARLPSPVVGLSPSATGAGYRLVTADGGVYAFGDASFEGSLAAEGKPPSIVGMAPTPSGRGYWLVGEDGGVFAFGDAPFAGSLAASPLPRPIVAVVATPSGRGYWLVGEDGGVFAFGDASFLGSTAGAPPSSPIVGAAASPSGRGYWLVGEDGGIFAFGDAAFKGSVADTRLSAPVVGVSPMTGIKGYWLAGADGSVYALGAPFLGARPGGAKAAPVVAVAAVPRRAPAPPVN